MTFGRSASSGEFKRNRLAGMVFSPEYEFSEVFDLKVTRGPYLKNSGHLSNFLAPRVPRDSVAPSEPLKDLG
jgi:hypothetical protein